MAGHPRATVGPTHHDGEDELANGLDPATEVIESEVPVLMLREEYVPDSAGAGINRGGAAVRKDTLYLADAEHWTNPLSTKRTNGGGGWGNRPEREPERVRRDVRDEYVTIRGAYDDYGVVIVGDPRTDPEGLRIDDEATRARRDELAGSVPESGPER